MTNILRSKTTRELGEMKKKASPPEYRRLKIQYVNLNDKYNNQRQQNISIKINLLLKSMGFLINGISKVKSEIYLSERYSGITKDFFETNIMQNEKFKKILKENEEVTLEDKEKKLVIVITYGHEKDSAF